MSLSLEGRVAIVTGAGRGLGRAVALGLARMGAKVVVNDIGVTLQGARTKESPADEVVREILAHGGKAVASTESVTEYESAGKIVATAMGEFGAVDILVNNAGTVGTGLIWEMDPKTFEDVVRVHLFGTFYMCRQATPHMKEKGWGRIVNIVSRGGLWGTRGAAPYGAGKGGIFGLTNVIAKDLAPFGVTVNGVNPSAMRTRMVQEAYERAKETGQAVTAAEQMLAQAQPPENVAAMVQYLCSEEAGGISGQYFIMEGNTAGWFQPLTVTQMAHTEKAVWTPEDLAAVIPSFKFPAPQTRYGGA